MRKEITADLTRQKGQRKYSESAEAFKLAEQDGTAKLEKLRKGENVELAWSAPKLVGHLPRSALQTHVPRPPQVMRRIRSGTR